MQVVINRQFEDAYRRLMAERGRPGNVCAADDLESWMDFVDKCEEGYPGDLASYDYEVDIRSVLEVAIKDGSLQASPGFDKFWSLVRELDRRFLVVATVSRPIFREGVLEWWDRKLPSKGSREFVDDVFLRYRLPIELA